MKYLIKIRSFFKVSSKERLLFFEALLFIAIARIAIRFFSFKKLLNYLGTPQTELPVEMLTEADKLYLQKIGKAIRRASRVAFWKTLCYEQAITGKLMLRRRKIGTTIYIGMMKSEEKGLEGHAWIRAGNYIVTGNIALEQYTIVGSFS